MFRSFSWFPAVVLGLLAALQGSAVTTEGESHGRLLDAVVDQTFGNLKRSSEGFLYVGVGPRFHILDKDGHLTSSLTLQIPNAARYISHDAARDGDAGIVVAGATSSSSDDSVPFLAWVSSSGSTVRIVRTAPYHAYQISVAPDHSVWTLGFEMADHNPRDASLNPQAGVLRHFSAEGRPIGSFWPQASFGKKDLQRLAEGRLITGRETLDWYSSTSSSGWYVELNLRTMEKHVYPAPACDPASGPIDGFAVTTADDVVLSCPVYQPRARAVYVFERAKSQWTQVEVPSLGGYSFTPNLLGSDGNKLVFEYGGQFAEFRILP